MKILPDGSVVQQWFRNILAVGVTRQADKVLHIERPTSSEASLPL
jgi:hypothetical protein